MIDPTLEFEIAQLADGMLPAERATSLRGQITSNSDAAELLASYEKLQSGLDALPSLPAIDWGRLAARISQNIDDATATAQEQAPVTYVMPWVRRVAPFAVAACVMMVVSLGLRKQKSAKHEIREETREATHGHISISGPAVDAPAGNIVAQIQIGPSPAVAGADQVGRYAESAVIVSPQRVVIASGTEGAQDNTQETPNSPY